MFKKWIVVPATASIAMLFCLLSNPALAQNQRPPGVIGQVPLWVNLSDISNFRPDLAPDAQIILTSINDVKNKTLYFPEGSTLNGSITIQNYPFQKGEDWVYGDVTATVQTSDKKLIVRRYALVLGGTPREVKSIRIKFDTPLLSFHFTISAGLFSQMFVLEDVENDYMIIFPLGVGSIDPGIMQRDPHNPNGIEILTPFFSNATLERSTIIKHLSHPSYYRGEAFLPVTNAKGLKTPIGFHITILSDSDWSSPSKGPNYLVRGFDSHGCMRLRERDLRELVSLIMAGASESIPVMVDKFVYNRDDWARERDPLFGEMTEIHPYPLSTKYYNRVKNFSKPGEPPTYKRDPVEHLVYLEKFMGQPDLTQVTGINGDEIIDLNIFKGLTEAGHPIY